MLTKFANEVFEDCKTSPLRVNENNKYKKGGKNGDGNYLAGNYHSSKIL